LPGNVNVKQSEGSNQLIQRGEAELITSAEDVLLELELKLKPIQIDKIATAANLSTSDCLVHLLSLEFKGLVKQLPGKMFALL